MQAIESTETTYPIEPEQAFGSHDALTTAWSKYSPMLYRIAFRKLRNEADAEDALQDALLSAYKNIDQFRGAAQLSTWLGSIVLNAARMQMRRRCNRDAVSIDAASEEGEPTWSERLVDSRPDPEELARQTETRELLERVVEELPPRIGTAFRLRVFEGLSMDQAAVVLGVPVGTVKARVFRAYRKVAALTGKALNSHRIVKRDSHQKRRASSRSYRPALVHATTRNVSRPSRLSRVHNVLCKPVDETVELEELCA